MASDNGDTSYPPHLAPRPGHHGGAPAHASGAPPIRCCAGPVVGTTTNRGQRNVVGTHSGSYGVYRALAVAAGNLTRGHRADLTNTVADRRWSARTRSGATPSKMVSIDPWGASVQSGLRRLPGAGLRHPADDRGDEGAHVHLPEIKQAHGVPAPQAIDGKHPARRRFSATVTKIALEPVWWLPGVARRFKVERR